MPFIHSSKKHFLDFLGISQKEVPEILVLIGTSDTEGGVKELEEILKVTHKKESGFPSVYFGKVGKTRIAFGTTYATSLTADIVHACSAAGTKRFILVGYCGVVNSGEISRGDVVVPTKIVDRNAIAHAYPVSKVIPPKKSFEFKHVSLCTWGNLFSESTELVARLKKEKIDVVDLESSAFATVCTYFKKNYEIYLIAADNLIQKEKLHNVYKKNQVNFSEIRRNLLRRIFE
jgi:nucleoside phosphorylase